MTKASTPTSRSAVWTVLSGEHGTLESRGTREGTGRRPVLDAHGGLVVILRYLESCNVPVTMKRKCRSSSNTTSSNSDDCKERGSGGTQVSGGTFHHLCSTTNSSYGTARGLWRAAGPGT